MPEVKSDLYKKIEKRIVNLKGKEGLWKTRYMKIAQQVKELVDANSQNIKEMEHLIRKFESRIDALEETANKTDSRNKDMFMLTDKRISSLSELTKGLSAKLEERDMETKRLKSDIISQLNTIISGHEKTFDNTLSKINLVFEKMQSETKRVDSLNERVTVPRELMQNFNSVPKPQVQDRSPPDIISTSSENEMLPSPPVPEMGGEFGEPPFTYEDRPARRMPRRAVPVFDDDLDDDLEVDDVIPGKMTDFKNSVDAMNTSAKSISDKLTAIEDAFAKMQTEKSSDVTKLEDKIRMYTESAAEVRSRMETLERAIKDGMTPMMETVKILVDTVKSIKEEQKKSGQNALQKPIPPIERKKLASPTSNYRLRQKQEIKI